MLKLRILPKCWIFAVAILATARAQTAGPPPVQSFPDSAKTVARPANDAASKTPRYATRTRKFTIPFSLVSQNQVIVEVTLYSSADRGQHWQQSAQAGQQQTEFKFAASTDGEYWFAVQTLNRNGQRVPVKIAMPELIVVVDTVEPTIDARSETDAAGRIKIDWQANDANLATDSLAIRYRPLNSPPEIPWTDVPAKITQVPSGPKLQDTYAFWPNTNELTLELEVSIRDQAGNQATTRTVVNRTQLAPQFAPLTGSPNGGSQNGLAKTTNSISPPDNSIVAAANPRQSVPSENASSAPGEGERNAGFRRRSTPSVAPRIAAQDSPTTSSASEVNPPAIEWRSARHSSSGKFSARGSTQDGSQKPAVLQPMEPVQSLPSDQPLRDQVAQKDTLRSTDPPTKPATLVSDRSETETDVQPHSVLSQPPVSAELQNQAISVNTKKFRLNYHVEAIDPAGVKEVAVWATRDTGKTWGRLGSIEDAKGPYPIEVDSSGLYGFRLVVISHSGLKSRLPQPGDPADKWIRVDVDPPVAKITSAPYGSGDQAGKLVINWEAHDDLLAVRPIELSYSTRPDGPWTTIEKGLRNTGSYAWSVQPEAPDRVYLRLTVRDEAGNEQVDQTSYAVDIADLYPRGRIQSVEPISDR